MQGEDFGLKPLIDGIKKYKEIHSTDSDLPELAQLMDTALKAERKSDNLNYVLLKESWVRKSTLQDSGVGAKSDREGRSSEIGAKIKGLTPSKIVNTLNVKRIEFLKKQKDDINHNIYTDIGRKEIMKRIRADPKYYKSRMNVMSGNMEYCHFIINDINDNIRLPLNMLNKCKEGNRNKFLLKLPTSNTITAINATVPTKSYTLNSKCLIRASIYEHTS